MISHNMPCERKLLLSQNAMPYYETMCVATCDSFRQESLLSGEEDWALLNCLARSCIERCIRLCKLKMLRITAPPARSIILASGFTPASFLMRRTYGDHSSMAAMNPTSTSEEQSIALALQEKIRCYPLPRCIAQMQRESLWRIHSGCGMKLSSAHNLHFCGICAMNGKGLTTKMRMCSRTDELCCVACPPGGCSLQAYESRPVRAGTAGRVHEVLNSSHPVLCRHSPCGRYGRGYPDDLQRIVLPLPLLYQAVPVACRRLRHVPNTGGGRGEGGGIQCRGKEPLPPLCFDFTSENP